MSLWEPFTERARRSINLAQEEAQRLGNNYIGTEHILLGIISEGESLAAKVLETLGVNLANARQRAEAIVGRGGQTVQREIVFSPRAKRVIELAFEESRMLNHGYIGTEHLLLGIFREGTSVAAQVLTALGVDVKEARRQMLSLYSPGEQASRGPAKILDGRALAAELKQGLSARSAALAARGIAPKLAVVMIGEDESSRSYVAGMRKLGASLGIEVEVDELPPTVDDEFVRGALTRRGDDPHVHGVILQQPLAKHLSIRKIADAIPVDKDVDGTNPINQGRLAFATGALFVPATPAAVMLLLERSDKWPLAGRDATVVGRSNVVGLPVSLLLLGQGATVTITHSQTRDAPARARAADVLVVAVGKPGLVGSTWIKPGATVIDVGTTVVDGKLRGDVDFDSAKEVAGEITPVPGGVGPVTNVALMRNVLTAAESLTG